MRAQALRPFDEEVDDVGVHTSVNREFIVGRVGALGLALGIVVIDGVSIRNQDLVLDECPALLWLMEFLEINGG